MREDLRIPRAISPACITLSSRLRTAFSLQFCGRLERPFLAPAKHRFAHLRAVASEGCVEFLEAADRCIKRAIDPLRSLDELHDKRPRSAGATLVQSASASLKRSSAGSANSLRGPRPFGSLTLRAFERVKCDTCAAFRRRRFISVGSMSAVKPTPRRLGSGGFISSRIAERIAVTRRFSITSGTETSCTRCAIREFASDQFEDFWND